jgi:DNA-binding MarR family transcriptional regulator
MGGAEATIPQGREKSTGAKVAPEIVENNHSVPAPAAWFTQVKSAGLPLSATSVARILSESVGERPTVAQIAAKTGLAPYSVQRATRRLQRTGWLFVEVSPGYRSNVYVMTVPGGAR